MVKLDKIVINRPKETLFLLLLCNSLVLIFISININKNNIDTAPIYTIKYDRPINVKPSNIK